jgi:endonuclease/exonuclease/phosphatase family metal-dependent hydrolase
MMLILSSVFLLGFVHFNDAQTTPQPLKVCSFNVQIFGVNKAKKEDVMDILGKIFRKYDLCLIQEIRDTKDESIAKLLRTINAKSDTYGMVISDRLGRTNSKEQYAFFYNKKKLSVIDSYHFPDEDYGDLFEREPFVVRFKAPLAPVKDFFIAGIHTQPENAKQEIADLVKVYDDAVDRFKITDGIIMGDYNAGCGYFAKKYWKENDLRNDPRFLWLIGDDINTTVGQADCPYDRVVVAGKNMRKVAGDAQTYYYDEEMGHDKEMAALVSDHYPVEFVIG